MFALEHPASASSWQLAIMNELLMIKGSERVNFDFCALGMKIDVDGVPTPVKKRTSVVTNSQTLARELKKKQCMADHEHANTLGGKIKQCEIYPEEFCEFVCKAVMSDKEVNAVSSARCRDHLGKSCGACWAFGGADDVTKEINQLMILEKTVHAHPHKEEDWESSYYDELYSGKASSTTSRGRT